MASAGGATAGCERIDRVGNDLGTSGARRSSGTRCSGVSFSATGANLSVTGNASRSVDVGSRVAHAGAGDSAGGLASRSTGTAVTAGGVTRLWTCETIRSNPAAQTTAATMPTVTTAAVIRSVNTGRRWRTRRRGFPRAFTERGRDSGSVRTAIAPQMSFTITLTSG